MSDALRSGPGWQITLVVGLACLAAACDGDGGEPLRLDVTSAVPVQALHVWVKSEDRGVRTVQVADGEPLEVAVPPGVDLTAAPLRIDLAPPEDGAPDVVYVHLVGLDGGRPVNLADIAVSLGSGTVTRSVPLVPLQPQCDLDGDTFVRCGPAGCCDHVDESLTEHFEDCLDDPGAVGARRAAPGCRKVLLDALAVARTAHPFRPASYGSSIDRCDDCIDQDCSGDDELCAFPDEDGDESPPPYDCDDSDPERHLGAPERCNRLDDDCDGDVDEGFDADRDGFTTCAGDCDDDDPDAHPGLPEVCSDGVDNTCTADGADTTCDEGDIDGDGYRSKDLPGGGTDCDDRDAGRHPGARERCGDTVDQDCDDRDAECPNGDLDDDGVPALAAGGGDCDDDDATIHPGAPDRCGDGVDQDCDGSDLPCAGDGDGDRYLPLHGDCDDRDELRHPGVPELCNGIDDDCDGLVDEANPRSLHGEAPAPLRCYTGPPETRGKGICTDGYLTCTRTGTARAELLCLEQVHDDVELCTNDGSDDDCNGVMDDVPGRNDPCDSGIPGACTAGHRLCVDGSLQCVADLVAEPDAACDGVDRDCDGVVDSEEILAAWHTVPCYTGPAGTQDVGICSGGWKTCQPDGYGACEGQVLPGVERCDNPGVDDDCTGADDDVTQAGEPELDRPCQTGLDGPCGVGGRGCVGDRLGCRQTIFPSVEQCDDQDNDCDGDIDEDFDKQSGLQHCGGCNQLCAHAHADSRCHNGRCEMTRCRDGFHDVDELPGNGCEYPCQPSNGGREVCDGADNDCDGDTDEVAGGCPPPGEGEGEGGGGP